MQGILKALWRRKVIVGSASCAMPVGMLVWSVWDMVLYSRVGFAHEMEPLSDEETHDFLSKRWSHRVKAYSDDFTDKEAIAAIVRIARGNIRLIERLMLQVEHVLVANQLQIVTKEVVETARQNLIIGPD